MKHSRLSWVGCPTRYAAGIVGDKWCFLLLRDVLLFGKRSYGEFLDGPERISTNILANRLSRLEQAGLLDRQIDPRKGSRVLYFPTQKARDLLPALLALMVWSTKYDPQTEAPASFAKAFESDPSGTIAQYEAAIEQVNTRIHEAKM